MIFEDFDFSESLPAETMHKLIKSYALVDAIEDGFATLEIEMASTFDSHTENEKKVIKKDISIFEIEPYVGEIKEGDILIVEHDDDIIYNFISKDEEEKSYRINRVKPLIEKLRRKATKK